MASSMDPSEAPAAASSSSSSESRSKLFTLPNEGSVAKNEPKAGKFEGVVHRTWLWLVHTVDVSIALGSVVAWASYHVQTLC